GGTAGLHAGGSVEVSSPKGEVAELEGGVILLACGSRPRHLDAIPPSDPDVHDSETILDIPHAPDSLVVVGDGAAGCEYASVFAAIGVRVTLVSPGSPLPPPVDAA